jgi:hypothetical protein
VIPLHYSCYSLLKTACLEQVLAQLASHLCVRFIHSLSFLWDRTSNVGGALTSLTCTLSAAPCFALEGADPSTVSSVTYLIICPNS